MTEKMTPDEAFAMWQRAFARPGSTEGDAMKAVLANYDARLAECVETLTRRCPVVGGALQIDPAGEWISISEVMHLLIGGRPWVIPAKPGTGA